MNTASNQSLTSYRVISTFYLQLSKLVRLHHHQADPEFSPITMNNCSLKMTPSLLELKLSSDLKWNLDMQSLAKKMLPKVSCTTLVSTWLLLLSSAFKRSRAGRKMEYCCHIVAGAAQFSRSSFRRIRKRLCSLVGDELFSTIQPLCYRRNIGSLLSITPTAHSSWEQLVFPSGYLSTDQARYCLTSLIGREQKHYFVLIWPEPRSWSLLWTSFNSSVLGTQAAHIQCLEKSN